MTRFIIARHGNTFADGEPARRIGARTDLALVDSGVAQARRLGRYFRDHAISFSAALTSPSRRATTTAAIILTEQDHEVAMLRLAALDEIDHGPDEDRPEQHVVGRLGAPAIEAWDRQGIAPPGWRVNADERIRFWRTLFQSRDAGTILIVTSSGSARFALLSEPALAFAPLKLRTGAYGEITHDAAGKLQRCCWDTRPCQATPP